MTNKNKKRILNKYIIWVGRISCDNNMVHSKPCSVCIKRLIALGFNKIGYSDNFGHVIVIKLSTIKYSQYTSSDSLFNCS